MARPTPPTGPYCYSLASPDGKVFYVGKGRGKRMFAHEKQARLGGLGAKCDRIREILADGGDVAYAVLGQFETDEAAFAAEKQWIGHFPNLTNATCGGGGTPISAKERIRLKAIQMLNRLRPMNEWIASMTKEHYEMLCKVNGSPQAFYEDLVASIKRDILEPTPTEICVGPDGAVSYSWT